MLNMHPNNSDSIDRFPTTKIRILNFLSGKRALVAVILIAILVPLCGSSFRPCSQLDTTIGLSGCQTIIQNINSSVKQVDFLYNLSTPTIVAIGSNIHIQLLNDRNTAWSFGDKWNTYTSIATDADDQFAVLTTDTQTVQLWNLREQSLERNITIDLNVTSAAISPTTPIIALGTIRDAIYLWDRDSETVTNILSFRDGPINITDLAYTPDGEFLATASYDYTIRIWKPDTGEFIKQLQGHTSVVKCVAYSNDGTKLVSGSYDNTVRIWEATDGTLLHTLNRHTNRIEAVAVSSAKNVIASSSVDGTVRLWRLSDGKALRTLRVSDASSVAFSPDGQLLAIGLDDGTIQIWKV